MNKLSDLKVDPNSLPRLLLVLGLVSMVLILTLSGIGIYRVASEAVLRDAEDDGVRIATVMVSQQYKYLFSEGEKNIALNSQELADFDRQTKDFLHPFAIVKIKVFDLNRVIIYSTDTNIIGMRVEDNIGLDRALSGEIDSHLETKDQFIDLVEEQLLDVDVVEMYLPVNNAAGEIAGSFELYLDVTRYRDDITHRVASSILILTTILLAVFALSFWVVRKGVGQLKELLARLHQMALIDSLTGAFNRAAVLQRAKVELSHMARRELKLPSAHSLGVVMLDLDHFKAVNDTYGHQAGDEVLRELSRRLIATLREHDTFGRYGGEEFLVLTPDCEYEGTMIIAERIRRCLSDVPFKIGENALHITASFGVTCCSDPTEDFDTTLQRADEALYKAKDSGRNRVVGSEVKEV
jgi:diguanylate cyclase (GGDEF)-like protein